jgi:GalNAc5-diNAcBac-PP-undecaprenol beta-1,3-glucosyltransferase
VTVDPLVTVIIPTYKRAGLVQRAIESVLRQTYRNIEILVVDDESPDDTAFVVKAIPDSRIKYIRHEKNKGLPAVRNTGIRAAKGELIAFLDDDDEWREDKLDKQIRAIKDCDAVLCTGVSDGYPQRVHKNPRITLDDLRMGSFNPSALLAKAYVLRDVMFDENLKQGEDWDAFIRIAQRYTIGWVDEPLLIYNDGGHARMTNEAKYLSGPELEKRAAMLHKHRKFFGEKLFMLHLADTFLSYIGSRPNKLQSIGYAVRRCGFIPVAHAIIDKVRLRFQRLMWTGS